MVMMTLRCNAQVEFGLQPKLSPEAGQRSATDLQNMAPMEGVRAASAVPHYPLDHDTQVLHTHRPPPNPPHAPGRVKAVQPAFIEGQAAPTKSPDIYPHGIR